MTCGSWPLQGDPAADRAHRHQQAVRGQAHPQSARRVWARAPAGARLPAHSGLQVWRQWRDGECARVRRDPWRRRRRRQPECGGVDFELAARAQ